MNKLEFDSIPSGPTPVNHAYLMEVARQYRDMESRHYKSISGTDVAEAPLYGLVADALGGVASGKGLDSTLELLRNKWECYVVAQQVRVNSAPKITHGPMAGASVIHHRWVSKEAWSAKEVFIRSLVDFG